MTFVSVSLLALLHVALAIASIYHVLLYKRDTRAAMGWIMAALFVPYGGPVAYYIFGINRVRTRAQGIRPHFFAVTYEVGQGTVVLPAAIGKGLQTVGQRITGRKLSSGNEVEVLHDGAQAYPAMLSSIEQARERILLATYILKTDHTGMAFADALSAAAARGVEVMVLVDGVGEFYSWPRPSKMLRKRGVNVGRFLPPRILPPSIYMNLRNHRKLLVVDKEIAYAGGINISDDHVAVRDKPMKVSDIHFGLRGPVISDLAGVFLDDWAFATGQKIERREPAAPRPDGEARCRVIADGPDDTLDALALCIEGVVGGAQDSVDVMTPYFLPSRELVSALQSAALRGARVRVVLPGKNNLFYMQWANRNLLAELIERGVQAYYQPAPFCHSKLLCIDDEYCLIGSANLDPRSLRLNFELGVEIFSTSLSAKLRAHVENVVAISEPITSEELSSRSTPVRLRDSLVSLFSPYL